MSPHQSPSKRPLTRAFCMFGDLTASLRFSLGYEPFEFTGADESGTADGERDDVPALPHPVQRVPAYPEPSCGLSRAICAPGFGCNFHLRLPLQIASASVCFASNKNAAFRCVS